MSNFDGLLVWIVEEGIKKSHNGFVGRAMRIRITSNQCMDISEVCDI